MAIINGVIPPEAFELIRDRIGQILVDELDNQSVLSYNVDLDVPVFMERLIPYAPADLPALNVMIERGEFDSEFQGQSRGTYRFIIEGCYSSEFTDDERGDTRSMLKLQKLLGVCRAILEDPKYKTLGFAPPFIMNRHVENFYFNRVIRQDAISVVSGRITLVVQAPETNALILPNLIKGFDTQVKLYLTDQGYMWSLDQPADTFSETFDETFG